MYANEEISPFQDSFKKFKLKQKFGSNGAQQFKQYFCLIPTKSFRTYTYTPRNINEVHVNTHVNIPVSAQVRVCQCAKSLKC